MADMGCGSLPEKRNESAASKARLALALAPLAGPEWVGDAQFARAGALRRALGGRGVGPDGEGPPEEVYGPLGVVERVRGRLDVAAALLDLVRLHYVQ